MEEECTHPRPLGDMYGTLWSFARQDELGRSYGAIGGLSGAGDDHILNGKLAIIAGQSCPGTRHGMLGLPAARCAEAGTVNPRTPSCCSRLHLVVLVVLRIKHGFATFCHTMKVKEQA